MRGLIVCAACNRRMEGSWNNGRVNYRCKLKTADTALRAGGHPASIYVREDRILGRVDGWLDGLFAPDRVESTIEALFQASADPSMNARRRAIAEKIKACDTKLASYRAALEAGADPAVVTQWISEITAVRRVSDLELSQLAASSSLVTRQQIEGLVARVSDVGTLLKSADQRERHRMYQDLGLRLTYKHAKRTMLAEAALAPHGDLRGVRGGT